MSTKKNGTVTVHLPALRRVRKGKGMSQDELALTAKLSRDTVAAAEAGRGITRETAVAIAAAADITLKYLRYGPK